MEHQEGGGVNTEHILLIIALVSLIACSVFFSLWRSELKINKIKDQRIDIRDDFIKATTGIDFKEGNVEKA